MHLEVDRIKSFKSFSGPLPYHQNYLIKNGFYYTGQEDIISCHSCGKTYHDWINKYNPVFRHAVNQKSCTEALKYYERFVLRTKNFPKVNISTPAVYPEYEIYQKRFLSFQNKEDKFKVTILDLAEAGFWSNNAETDEVVCFKCGVAIKNWKKGDNCWLEHGFNRPVCPFVNEIMGNRYLVRIQQALAEIKQMDPNNDRLVTWDMNNVKKE